MRILPVSKKIFRQVFHLVAGLSIIGGWGCGMKVKYLPDVPAPYISELGLYKKVTTSDNGEVRRVPFAKEPLSTPCYFYLRLENVENQGELVVRFYSLRRIPASRLLTGLMRSIRFIGVVWIYHPMSPVHAVVRFMEFDLTDMDMALTAARRGEIAGWVRKVGLHLVLTGGRLPSFEESRFFWSRYAFQSQLEFAYGQPGAYYGHIMFIDRVAHLPAGPVIYVGTLNGRLIFEKSETVGGKGESHPPLHNP